MNRTIAEIELERERATRHLLKSQKLVDMFLGEMGSVYGHILRARYGNWKQRLYSKLWLIKRRILSNLFN